MVTHESWGVLLHQSPSCSPSRLFQLPAAIHLMSTMNQEMVEITGDTLHKKCMQK